MSTVPFASPYAAVLSDCPGIEHLSLGRLVAFMRLGTMIQRHPGKLVSYPYLAKVMQVSSGAVRGCIENLVTLGLVRKTIQGGSATSGQRYCAGTIYRLTPVGERLQSFAQGLMCPRSTVTATTTSSRQSPGTTETGRAGQGTPPPTRIEDLAPTTQARIAAWPADAQAHIRAALAAGHPPSPPVLATAGLDFDTAMQFASFIANKQSPVVAPDLNTPDLTSDPDETPDTQHAPTRVGHADATASEQSALEHGLTLPSITASASCADDLQAVLPYADLVMHEAAVRYRKVLRDPGRFVSETLPQVLWAITKGSLADYGSPIKRIRVALSLVWNGRWGCPRGFDTDFGDRFSQSVRVS